jgi:dihydrofolate synthase / folylpolyglutamate synthase
MLDAILRAAGYRVGLYTSPHLLAFNERARIDGEAASDAALVEQFEAVEAARGTTTLTYFEFTTLAILRLFAQRGTGRRGARGRARRSTGRGQHRRRRRGRGHVD